MNTAPEYLYRCDGFVTEEGASVSIHSYRVLGVTPFGYWIDNFGISKKWVSNSARKRWAYPSIDDAVKSFQARKRRQVSILTKQLENAKAALELHPSKYLDCTQPLRPGQQDLIPLHVIPLQKFKFDPDENE